MAVVHQPHRSDNESNLDAFRLHGAKGFETAAEEGLLDVLSSVTYSGTSDLQKVIIASALGLTT